MDMALILVLMVGVIIGLGVCLVIISYRTGNTVARQRTALVNITSYQWGTGKHNDAVVITRIALRGLDVE